MTDELRRRPTPRWHVVVRVALVVGIAVSAGILVNRVRRSPEQIELTRYVEIEAPALERMEAPARDALERLGGGSAAAGGALGPEEARKLLVDDVIPRLLKLKKQASEYRPETAEVRALHEEYLRGTERLIEACRACVRVIDDPKLPEAEGLATVRREFAAVREAYATWQEHVEAACRRHRLVRRQP
jgi:hypothetical protein